MGFTGCCAVVLAVALAMPAAALAQTQTARDTFPEGSPLTRLPVYEAPFSAVAVTRADLRLPDGIRLAQRTTARYFRDTNGRVRIEHRMDGLPEPRTVRERRVRLMLVANPCSGGITTVDPTTRTVGLLPRDVMARTAGSDFVMPVGGVRFLHVARPRDIAGGRALTPPGTLVDEEALGSRTIGGVETFGHRVTMTTLAQQVGNDRPITVTDEWWYSPDLRLVMAADYKSTDLGTISYRVTQLRGGDQPEHLFTLPEDYELDSMVPSSPSADPLVSFSGVEGYVRLVRERLRRPVDRRP
jgi:hypothetical protein